MGRLIEADKLRDKDINGEIVDIFDVLEAPTVEAIPIEWLKKYFNHRMRSGKIWYYDMKEDKLYQAWKVDDIIDDCYRDWEKEHEGFN